MAAGKAVEDEEGEAFALQLLKLRQEKRPSSGGDGLRRDVGDGDGDGDQTPVVCAIPSLNPGKR